MNNNIRKVIFAGIFFLVLFPGLKAQQKVWSLEECIDLSLQNNISLNQKKLSGKLDEINLEQSKAGVLPSLTATGSQSFNFGRSVDPYSYDYIEQNISSSNLSLNSNFTLFNGFQTKNNIKKDEIDLKAGNYDLEKTEDNVILDVTQAYLQVLYAYEQVENSETKVKSTEAQVKRTEILVSTGSVPEGDLLKIKSQLATDNYSLVNNENQLSILKVNLMQIMEMPVTDGFDIKRPDFIEPDLGTIAIPESEKVFQDALMQRPEIQEADLMVESAKTSLDIAKGARLPRLILSAGITTGYSNTRNLYSRESILETREIGYLQSNPSEIVVTQAQMFTTTPIGYPYFNQLQDNLSESIRLSLSIPIFDRKQVQSNIKRSEININTAKLSAQNTRNQLRKTIEQAYNDMIAARKNLQASREQLKSIEKSFVDTERKFKLGMVNATDYLIEKNNFEQAKSNLTRAKYELIFKQKILEFYQDKPIVL